MFYTVYRLENDPYTRIDANCTPGKTIACGKVCRKPENCKSKTGGQYKSLLAQKRAKVKQEKTVNLGKSKTEWESYNGKQPWQVERDQWGGSIMQTKKPIQNEIFSKIQQEPEFKELKAKVDRSLKSLYGKSAPEQTPEQYLQHTEYNSKSKKSQEINALQFSILNKLGVKARPGRYRGNAIDWHKAAVMKAVEDGQPVPSNVLKSFGLK